MKPIPNEYWKAIVENDASYDDTFFYGVKTTGIFCRPSCKSRVPNKENVRIFKNAKLAQSENFRPCKRCKPDGLMLPDKEWIEQIVDWIDQHYYKPLTLETLSEFGHSSPYHLQRTFKRVKGMSPLEYIQQVRISHAIHYLMNSDKSVTEIGMMVGLTNTAYFITLFKKKTKCTPTEYRKKYGGTKEETIHEKQ
ncbi:AraC family transcriptional regulator of adaptative response / methylphosphotriester-DNA alkyltransferase methyltransferase [Bacillus pakistanensis]|uniref:AraC family transcriptional regulator of adaptative response / methylphosphotriester-DNA alkyltransferase methyltransferase n=1 Tax=Rossellomorea pakistanensis TaxID=992288 RepID=A0ABS2N6P0_9BACI|nr:bifunctional transcriptional activator/DNA repair enzyme AdaA [Bacillus pakistanensis]MBM7583494.1 AraC family transcriptional regulator of adaptative response / methylphosphotriester-DNA alkyltransferase methyltransferase [Bacillus pakistanensis]